MSWGEFAQSAITASVITAIVVLVSSYVLWRQKKKELRNQSIKEILKNTKNLIDKVTERTVIMLQKPGRHPDIQSGLAINVHDLNTISSNIIRLKKSSKNSDDEIEYEACQQKFFFFKWHATGDHIARSTRKAFRASDARVQDLVDEASRLATLLDSLTDKNLI